jgi:hypothetical protein
MLESRGGWEELDMASSSIEATSRANQDPPIEEVPIEELLKHRGRWVAFSPDGRRIVASSANLAELDALVQAAGEDPEKVLFEQIPDGDFIQSGAELT